VPNLIRFQQPEEAASDVDKKVLESASAVLIPCPVLGHLTTPVGTAAALLVSPGNLVTVERPTSMEIKSNFE
jgi:hypothetical protein